MDRLQRIAVLLARIDGRDHSRGAFTSVIEISFHIGIRLLLAKVFVWYNFGTGASEPIRQHIPQ
jgi:hypothetical protein